MVAITLVSMCCNNDKCYVCHSILSPQITQERKKEKKGEKKVINDEKVE
jgi:hypothetical protein